MKKNSSHGLKRLLYKTENVTHWDKMTKVTYLSWLISTALCVTEFKIIIL